MVILLVDVNLGTVTALVSRAKAPGLLAYSYTLWPENTVPPSKPKKAWVADLAMRCARPSYTHAREPMAPNSPPRKPSMVLL